MTKDNHYPFPDGGKSFYLCQSLKTSCGAQPTSTSVGTGGFFPQWLCGNGVNLITQVHVIYGKYKNACSCTSTPAFPLMV
jgi:hypothetical protein